MQSLVVWWAALSAVAALAGACSSSISKRPARPARPGGPGHGAPRPAPPPSPRANITFPTSQCPEQYSDYYCLNGGVCFTVVISNSPIFNCECKEGFVGQRCEFKDLENSYVLMRGRLMMETASIAGGATVAVFLAILVCVGAWVRLQRRGKRAALEEGGAGAGSERSPVQLVAVASGGRLALDVKPSSERPRPAPCPARPGCDGAGDH